MIEDSIYLVNKEEIIKLEPTKMTAEVIGGKALGLCQIPRAWSVPFFVISKELFTEYVNHEDISVISNYIDNIKRVVCLLNIKDNIILRSSAVNEGMNERGKFDSIETTINNIEVDLVGLLNNLKSIPNKGMPIIVQELVSPVFTGHLSNERRFSQENRDWKIEIYYKNGQFDQDTIGIRPWRTKYNISDIIKNKLVTDSKSVTTELQKVAFYWHKLSKEMKCRFHIEFVFDGEYIYIVQADRDYQKSNAVNPKSYNIKVNRISETWTPKILKQYNPIKSSEYHKLQNIKNYNDLGFPTVPLFFLDDIHILSNLQKGIVCDNLKEDIETLLKIQSIVIRMDISCSDKSQKQMLPRSNEIRQYDDVILWLMDHVNIILEQQKGIFLFHNFVPATSSAFAHAIPNGRLVKIQSLWGLPEGLYYNYHDTIIVDLGSKKLDSITESDVKVTIKNKYKDLFICPDKEGNWVACEVKEPYDWKCSIENNESIFDIALKSQLLANKLQEEISVMWFVGIDDSFYGASNLPWFHEKISFASYTTDEYKRKYFKEEEIIINNSEELQNLISSGNVKGKKCFRLKPNCEKDLRNKDLIINIGKIAAENDIMILLDGTQLTHSYYQLKSTGAKVVCSNKDELLYSDTLEFNKLVRDKIPEKIISNGEHVLCSKVMRPLLDRMLLEKLLEEAYEVNDATTKDDIISELADLTEICNEILCINTESPISCHDILNNKKNYFRSELRELIVLKIPTTIPIYTKTFKFDNLCGSVSIQRKKTNYRVELILQNYPIIHMHKNKSIHRENFQIQKIKKSIVIESSLALNSKSPKVLINHINKIMYHVNGLCEELGITLQQVIQKSDLKRIKVGGFKKGYVLRQTALKDNIIDQSIEFTPSECSQVYSIEKEIIKYCELLNNFEEGKKSLLIRFSVPIAVNKWEVEFDNSKIEEMLPDIQSIIFDIQKNTSGKLVLTVNSQTQIISEQLSFFSHDHHFS